MTLPPLPRPPGAAHLLRRIQVEHGSSRVVATITGPGGSGKTALLAELAEAFRSTGVAVRTSLEAPQGPDGPEALLLDDVHRLSEDEVVAVEGLVASGDAHVVLARRPWPQPPRLRRLVAAMPDSHVDLALGPLTDEEVAHYTAAALDAAATRDLAAEISRVTGGMPWLVRRVVAARAAGAPHRGPVVPEALHDALGSELTCLDPDIRDLVLQVALGFDPSGQVPPPVLEPGADPDLVARAKAEGVLGRDARPVPLVAAAAVAAAPPHRVTQLRSALLDSLAAHGLPVEPGHARAMADAGVRHPLLERALLAAGDDIAPAEPHVALELYQRAVAAGAAASRVAGRRAWTLLAAGDLDAAARAVDEVFRGPDARNEPVAADVAATLWARRGMLHRAADVYRWLDASRAQQSLPLAVATYLGIGDLEAAESLLALDEQGSPTDLVVALRLLARGLHESVVGDPTRAQALLLRSSDTLNALGGAPPLPEAPAVAAALVATGTGQVPIASAVLDEALRARQCGPAAQPGLLLWRAWAAMLEDDQHRAATALAEARGLPLHGRDVCLAAAVEVGLARRTYDPATIRTAWHRAREHVLRWPPDLFTVAPLAELQTAAARCGEAAALTTQVDDAWALLDGLGRPAPWSVPLHWGAVQAAILGEGPTDLGPHAAALAGAAPGNALAAAMAPAVRAWATVVAQSFDVGQVEDAAVGLARAGMAWDGARLVSQAATRTTVRKDQARLLATARDLRPAGASAQPGTPDPPPARPAGDADGATAVGRSRPGSPPSGVPLLSDREREVADLLVAGRTYREIGATLFMSPRTAEHHVARIRRRLGATSRADLLDRLRAAPDADAV